MSNAIPGLVTFPRPGRRVRVTNYPHLPSGDVVVLAGQVDSGNSGFRTSFLRPAYCLVKVTSSGKYVAANDASGDRNAPASVTALITAGVAHQNDVITLTVDGGPSFTVTMGAADDTDAEIAAALNANARFAGQLIADVQASRVRIRTLSGGAHKTLLVSDSANTLFGAAASPSKGVGTDADYLVTEDYVDMLNGSAASADAAAKVTFAGHYDAANLINPTAECLAVLARRGSRFYGTPTLVG